MGYQKTFRFVAPDTIVEKMILLSSDIKDWSSFSRKKGSLWYKLGKCFLDKPSNNDLRNLQDRFHLNRRGLRDGFKFTVRSAGLIACPCPRQPNHCTERKLQCGRCETWYNRASIQQAVNTATYLCSTYFMYMCPRCGPRTEFNFSFPLQDELNNQESEANASNLDVTKGENDDIGRKISNRAQTKQKRKAKKRKTFQCPLCFKNFQKLKHLQIHCAAHTNEKPVRCGHCGYEAAFRSSVQRHISSTHANIEFPFIIHLLNERECLECDVTLPTAEFIVHCEDH